MRRFTRKRPDVGAETKVRCEVGPRPDPMSLWARGKRPVQDGAVVLIQASGGTELRCQYAVARQLAPGRVRNAVTEYRRGPWLTWPHRSIISRYAAGHSSLYRCSTMPCSSQGSPGDRQRKTSSYTPSLAPIPPPRVLEEILWRRRSGISLGTPLATSAPLYRG